MAISKSDLKFYLTSLEPDVEQTIYSQSIGGYPAIVSTDLTKSLVYPETTFAHDDGLNSGSLVVSDYTKLTNCIYIDNGGEIIEIDQPTENDLTVVSRGVNSVRRAVAIGDIVRGINTELFNNSFNKSFKQYRCFALRNNNATDSAYDVSIFLKRASQNLESTVKIAIEIPKSDYETGVVTIDGNNKRHVVSSTFASVFDDNLFVDASLKFTSGSNVNQSRIVSSFDSSDGAFVVDSNFPYTPSAGDAFEIFPAPSQRISTGIVTPLYDSDYVSDFIEATADNKIGININSNRIHGDEMKPKDVVYVWIERSLKKTALNFAENSVSIGIRYSVV